MRGKIMKRSIGPAMVVIALTGFATLAEAQGRRLTTLSSIWALLGVRRPTDTAASQIADG